MQDGVGMTTVENGWDGVRGSLLGGVLSALTALIVVFLAQWLSDRRRRKGEKRAAADALLLEIANTRDAAVHSRSKSRSGAYDLWPLRHQIYVSHPLHGLPVMESVQNFYDAVSDLRQWVRDGPVARGDRVTRNPTDERAFTEYGRAVDAWAGHLIEALRDFEAPMSDVATTGPSRPQLPY